MGNRFSESSYYKGLHNDITHSYRQIGHALDNYGVEICLKSLNRLWRGSMRLTGLYWMLWRITRVYKVINHDIELMLENDSKASYEADSYTLSDGRRVVWDPKLHSFIDKLDRVYTPVSENENIIGFELKE